MQNTQDQIHPGRSQQMSRQILRGQNIQTGQRNIMFLGCLVCHPQGAIIVESEIGLEPVHYCIIGPDGPALVGGVVPGFHRCTPGNVRCSFPADKILATRCQSAIAPCACGCAFLGAHSSCATRDSSCSCFFNTFDPLLARSLPRDHSIKG